MYYDHLKKRAQLAAAQRAAMTASRTPIEKLIAPPYQSLHSDLQCGKYQKIFLPGGRGSGKSSFVSIEIVDGLMQNPTANAIVFRKTAATLRESVFSQIQWAMSELGVSSLWRSSISPMRFTHKITGQVVIFRGADDVGKIKSIRPPQGFFQFIWLEELSEFFGPNEMRNILQSVMRGGNDFRVFASFNPPISINNWSNQLVLQPDDKAITFRTDYRDMPREWLGQAFIDEAERLKSVNEKAYRHEYLGEPTGSGGEVFPNLEARTITDDEIEMMQYRFCGIDFGYSIDPAAVIYLAYDKKSEAIFFIGEIYVRGTSNRELADLIRQKGFDANEQTLFADSAEPKSCADLRKLGLRVLPVPKWGGSVRYRISWLQHRRLVVDPARCPNTFREFSSYEYARTRDGELTADLPDKNNHTIDGTAYSLALVIGSPRNPS